MKLNAGCQANYANVDRPHHRFGGRIFSGRGFLRKLRSFDPQSMIPLSDRMARPHLRVKEADESSAIPGKAMAAGMSRRRPSSRQGIKTEVSRPADQLQSSAERSLQPDIVDSCGATLHQQREQGRTAKFGRGFERHLVRETENERTLRERRTSEEASAAAVRAEQRRARLRSQAYGDGINVLTLQDAPQDALARAMRSTSAPHAKRVWLGGGSAESKVDRLAAGRMMDSGLRYYLPQEHGSGEGSRAARAALLAREGLPVESAARLRRSSLLGLGRLDLPSSGTADAMEQAAYGVDAGSPQRFSADPERVGRVHSPPEVPIKHSVTDPAAMAAAASDARRVAVARRAARSARAHNNVFDPSSPPTLLPSSSNTSRFASPRDEAIASSQAARKVLGGGAGAAVQARAAPALHATGSKLAEASAVRALEL